MEGGVWSGVAVSSKIGGSAAGEKITITTSASDCSVFTSSSVFRKNLLEFFLIVP
jgi:hypothetical protein